jgi:hypothetical protein
MHVWEEERVFDCKLQVKVWINVFAKALIYTENMIEERWKNSANAQLKPITVALQCP